MRDKAYRWVEGQIRKIIKKKGIKNWKQAWIHHIWNFKVFLSFSWTTFKFYMKYVRDSLKINNYWSLNAHFQIKSWAWTITPEAYSQPCETTKMERFASVNWKWWFYWTIWRLMQSFKKKQTNKQKKNPCNWFKYLLRMTS